MIHVLAIDKHAKPIGNLTTLQSLHEQEHKWVWVDFDCPTEEEAKQLETHFRFHPLAVEDCVNYLQRPKMDPYEDHIFFVLHSLNRLTLEAEEIDVFLGPNYLVTYHKKPHQEIDEFRAKLTAHAKLLEKGPLYAAYILFDKIVDYYFPSVYRIEDHLLSLENNEMGMTSHQMMEQVFELRADLLKIRKTIIPMRDMLYRVINSEKLEGIKLHMAYFRDVHDHLMKLSEMVEANREMTADIRDNFISVNSFRMNNIMKTLTVITTIFMPLTFIAGIYGMNFLHMPELNWQYGYFGALAVMACIGLGMYLWFRNKGWFK
ncbi:magnesium/cobalt transporter CorA [Paenibacillus koleovorans]|uniref:magnesium/cobalt transporter CorA n=1 Tax=Paenibacillus koleovorans TaxID=121608 RepID=UPI000FDAE710|nr:magnesium/cobalt transporter CorA [Paenibacillus koleovorans]